MPLWDAQSGGEAEAALTPAVGLGPLCPIQPGVPTSPASSLSTHRHGAEDASRRSSSAGGRQGLGVGLCRERNQSPASPGEVAWLSTPARQRSCQAAAVPHTPGSVHPVSLCCLGGCIQSGAGHEPSHWCHGMGLHGKGVSWARVTSGGEGRVVVWWSPCCQL